MQYSRRIITVPDNRIQCFLVEFEFALRQMSASEIGQLVAVDSTKDFLKSVFRRGKNIAFLFVSVQEFSQTEIQQAVEAWQGEETAFAEHAGKKSALLSEISGIYSSVLARKLRLCTTTPYQRR